MRNAYCQHLAWIILFVPISKLLQAHQLPADDQIFRDKTDPDQPNCDVHTRVPELFLQPVKIAEAMASPSTLSVRKKAGVQLSQYVTSEFIKMFINYCTGKMYPVFRKKFCI